MFMERKAKYIVIEGMDGAGKTTQKELLEQFLSKKGYRVKSIHEPNRDNPVGKFLREKLIKDKSYSPETLALAFATDRLVMKDEMVKKILQEYDYVVSDRDYHSSLVYQPLMGLELSWVKKINKYAIEPDLTIILDIDMEAYKKRKGETSVRFENMEFQRKVRKGYFNLKNILQENIHVLDGNKDMDSVLNDTIKLMRKQGLL